MSKKLVAYFSGSGTTADVAKMLAEAAEAPIYEIRPQVPYTGSDLNWLNDDSRSTMEMEGKIPRSEVADQEADIAAYDVILLGFPIWWYTAPKLINSFVESYDFSGKTIVLFATSGGSGFGRALESVKGSAGASAIVQEGKIFNDDPTKEDLKEWVESLGV